MSISQSIPSGTCTVSQDDGVSKVQAAGTMTTIVDAVTDKVKLCAVEVEGGVVYIKGHVGDAVFFIKAKLSELGSAEALAPLKVSALRVRDGVVEVSGSVGNAVLHVTAQGHDASQKALHAYLSMSSAINNNVSLLMAPVREWISVASTKVHHVSAPIFGPCVVYVRDGLTYASGKVNGAVILVKARGDHAMQNVLAAYANVRAKTVTSAGQVHTKVQETYSAMISALYGNLQNGRIQINDGFLYMMGKINETQICIKVKLTASLDGAISLLKPHYMFVKDGCHNANAKLADKVAHLNIKLATSLDSAKTSATALANDTTKLANAKVAILLTGARNTVADDRFKTTAGSAVAGAAALGTTGGATGFVAGGAFGAALGIVPAMFTFGLSIPIGAALGSGAGFCVGTATGTAVGFIGGGATAHGLQTHKAKIQKEVDGAFLKLGECKEYAKNTAANSSRYVKGRLSGATGGTDSDE